MSAGDPEANGGFRLTTDPGQSAEALIYDIRFIYYGVPPVDVILPDRMTLSGDGTKFGPGGETVYGDQRECPTSACNDTQGYAADPINTRTGGFDFSTADIFLPTPAGPLVFQRSYASPATQLYSSTLTSLGYGWTHNQDTRLIFADDPGGTPDTIWFKAHTANQFPFTDHEDGTFTPYPGVLAALTYDGSQYTLITLISAQDAYENEMGKTYDQSFRPHQLTDKLDHASTLNWSLDGVNLEYVKDALGNEAFMSYDNLNNLTSKVDPRNFETTYTYEGTLLKTVADALGYTTVYTYTPAGLLAAIEDPLHNVTNFTYNALGQMVSKTDALLHTTTYIYDGLGRLIETTDPLGRTTRNEYDTVGRLVRVTENVWDGQPQNYLNEYNIATEYEYDAAGKQTLVRDTLGRETEYAYDDNHRMIQITDADENTTIYTYDPNGNLATVTDALGRMTRNTYDQENRLIQIEQNVWDGQPQNHLNEYNLVTQYEYDANGNQTKIIDTYGHVTLKEYDALNRVAYETRNYAPNHPQNYLNEYNIVTYYKYDEVGNVERITDTLNRRTWYDYNALNQLIGVMTPDYGYTEHFYDGNGNRIQTIDPMGNPTTYEYDALNRLVRVTDALGHEVEYGYDAVGNRITLTDQNEHTTTYTYDGLDRQKTITDPLLNPVKTTTYDPAGNVLSVADALNRTYTYEYDNLNRVTLQTDPLQGKTGYTYDALGNRLSVTDANTHTTSYTYDTLNRLTVVTDANLNHPTTYTYDAVGNVLSTASGLGHVTSYTYDGLYRQISVTDPLLNTTQYAYDAVNNQISVINAMGVVTQFYYDDLNRMTRIKENYQPGVTPTSEINVQTVYTYDFNSSLLTVTDANGHPCTYGYDDLNRVETETNALEHAWSYNYDPAGNKIGLLDANGQLTTFSYDARNLLIAIDYPVGTADVAFTYNAAGERITMTDDTGTTTWAYDVLSRPIAITAPLTGVVGYTYDAVGNRQTLSYPDGKTVAYTYDPANRLTQVTDWQNTVTTYTYDAADRLTTITLPNGTSTGYIYDEASQLLTLTHASGGIPFASFTYTYDGIGNRMTANETTGGAVTEITYTYDALRRLIQAIYTIDNAIAESFEYTYDPAGNRLAETSSQVGEVKYDYDAANRLTEANHQTLVWDQNGNLLQEGQKVYIYDAANRLVTYSSGDGPTIPYTYNGLGDRVKQGATSFTLDLAAGLSQVLSYSTRTYLYGLTRLGEQDSTTGWSYHHPDALGSVHHLTNVNGAPTLSRIYEPFGGLLSETGTATTAYGYTGEWTDTYSNLLYLRARFYAPWQGRFLTRDTWQGDYLRPASLHRYTYAENNPVLYTDPSGHFIDTALDVGFLLYDLYRVEKVLFTGCGDLESELLALGLDAIGAAVPFATGLGMAARLGSKADNVLKLVGHGDEIRDLRRVVVELGSGNFRNLPKIIENNRNAWVIGVEHYDELEKLVFAQKTKGAIFGDLLNGYKEAVEAGADIRYLDYITDLPSKFADRVISIAPNPVGTGGLANRYETAEVIANIVKPQGSIYVATESPSIAADMAAVLANKLGVNINYQQVLRQQVPYISEYLDYSKFSYVIDVVLP